MTRMSSAAIDIGGAKRVGSSWPRNGSDEAAGNGIDDMSFIGTPPMAMATFPASSYDHITHLDLPNSAQFGIQTVGTDYKDSSDRVVSFAMSPTSSSAVVSPSPSQPNEALTSGKKTLRIEQDVPLVPGEETIRVTSEDACPLEGGTVMLTNYRIIFLSDTTNQTVKVFPLNGIELTDYRDQNQVVISMKEGRVQRFKFTTYEDAVAWHRQLTKIVSRLNRGGDRTTPVEGDACEVFAWKFSEAVDAIPSPKWLVSALSVTPDVVRSDFDRLEMKDAFRISNINDDFIVCETYPERVVVPATITDEDLKKAAGYRGLKRFPAVVWRNKSTNAVLLRSAQPQVGILSWRNELDEKIIQDAVSISRTDTKDVEKKPFVILDCRSYGAAFANRARSGGFENTENYQQAKMEFLGLPNIHTVRNSFVAMRTLLSGTTPNEQLLASLQHTGWLQNLSTLLMSAATCADHLGQGHCVLVHCSDGWDRTTQMVSLAKLMVDEYYRTLKGFEELVRREWVAFGHKLYDRQQSFNGNWDAGERSPVFLQFLEAVRHLQREQPTAFQFTHAYLIKLAQHAYSGLFGTFLFNSQKEQRAATVARKGATLVEIWRYLGEHNEEFVNQSYDDTYAGRLKTINFSTINLRVWHEVFADDEERFASLYSAPSAATSPTSSPSTNNGVATPKDISLIERPASGCGLATPTSTPAPIQKSKSSESISSMTNVDGAVSTANLGHSGSNGTISSLEATAGTSLATTPPNDVPPQFQSTPMVPYGASMTTSMHLSATSWVRRATTVQETLDYDGLLKFQDDEQEIQRRKNKKLMSQIQKQKDMINEMSRQRSVSERAAHSNGNGHSVGYRMHSLCEQESETESMERAFSDISMVDPNELPKQHTYWEMSGSHCRLCRKQFSTMSVHMEEREHHCRYCGQVVCDNCSQRRYHTIEEGRGVSKRVCDSCYKDINGRQQEENATNGSGPRDDVFLSRASSMSEVTSLSNGLQPSSSSPSSISLNNMPSPAQPIPSPCKSTSSASPRPSPGGEFSRHGSTQAVKG